MNDILILALTSHSLGGSPISRKIWRDLAPMLSRNPDPSELEAWARKNLAEKDAELVAERVALLEDAESLKDDLAAGGIGLLTVFEDAYPQKWLERLGDQSPSLLYTAGNLALLNEPSVGIVGSRDVDEEGSAFAREAAEAAVGLGFAIVSGGARGVDQISMNAAFEAGGKSIGILADSMGKTVGRRETAGALESGAVCLVSPFSPSAGFQVGNAMSRNKLIYAMSVCTVVVAAAEGTGGTWAGAVEAIDRKTCPVLVRSPGDLPVAHKKLISMGGVGISSRSDLMERLANPDSFVTQPSLL